MQLVISNGTENRIVKDGDELPQGFKVIGEFIPLGSEREIGRKDIKGVELSAGNIVVSSGKGIQFHTIQAQEFKTEGGIIWGYFIPDGAVALKGKM